MNKRVTPPAEAMGAEHPAPDAFTGLGGSYVRNPDTGKRTPTDETLIHHKNHGKVEDGQENP